MLLTVDVIYDRNNLEKSFTMKIHNLHMMKKSAVVEI